MAIYKLKDFIALLLHCAWEAFNFFLNLDILTFWRDSETADWQYKNFLLYPYVYNFTVKNKRLNYAMFPVLQIYNTSYHVKCCLKNSTCESLQKSGLSLLFISM